MSIEDFIGKYNHLEVGLFKDNVTNDITEDYMRQLVQDIADTFSISATATTRRYADITNLLANTDLNLNGFALVDDASGDANVNEGWALYILLISAPTDLASYQLIAKQYATSGSSFLIDIAYDATADDFKATGGTGPGGAIRKGNYYFVGTESTTAGLFPTGALVTALVNDPGQTSGNWNVNY